MFWQHYCVSFKKNTMMNKGILLAICIYLIPMLAQAQEKNEFEDLLLLFVDEKYDKCMQKAEKYTLKDNTKREPMPYLYIAMCMFEISRVEEAEEDNPRAFKDALSYSYKYVRKDKNMLYFDDNADFFASLRIEAMLKAENQLAEEKYSRAKYYYRALAKIDPKDPSALFMQAYCELRSNATRDAMNNFNMAMEYYLALSSLYVLTREQQALMSHGFTTYAKFLIDEGRSDSAFSTLDYGKKLFLDDKQFMDKYEELKSN
ncbi:MAG: tetratricopeptide (TPR) repeat protein [Flavobacteriales bacterium]|jgi:tetratricopeptide (TPR) repeat protein